MHVEQVAAEPRPCAAGSGPAARATDTGGPPVAYHPSASIPIPTANTRRGPRGDCGDHDATPKSTSTAVCQQPAVLSVESLPSFMETQDTFADAMAAPGLYSPCLVEEDTQPSTLVAPTGAPFSAGAVTAVGAVAAVPDSRKVVVQYDGSPALQAVEGAHGISVQLPAGGAAHITTSSSDEASPQLVHVLRRSETLQRQGHVFQGRKSDGSGGDPDADMHPVDMNSSGELPDDTILDDTWVTVEDVLEDAPAYDSPSPSSFGQKFLHRHVYPKLRKMSPP